MRPLRRVRSRLRLSLPAVLVLVPALWGAACRPPGPPVDRAAEEAEIRRLTSEWFAAESRRDVEGVLAMLAPDVVVQAPGEPTLHGVEAMRASLEEFFQVPYTEIVEGERTVVVAGSGDLAYDAGTWVVRLEGADGPRESTGKSTLVWRKLGGQWKCVLLSYSSDPAPSEPALTGASADPGR